jgi:hypothetical protein
MSKSNPRLTNPASKFIEFKGDSGQFFYFDKETEQKTEVKMPIYFVVLDELSAIKGFNEKHKCGIYSNEIRSIKDDILNVKTFKGGVQIVGKYNDIKDAALREGGKFCKSVYVMLITGKDKYELANFQFHGASFGAWMDKKFNVEKFAIAIEETSQDKKGNVTYTFPVFTKKNLSPDIDKAAIEMDRQLQVYLASYLNQQIEEKISDTEVIENKETEFYPDEHWDNLKVKRNEEKLNMDDSEDLPF